MFPCEIQEIVARPTLSIRFRAPVTELPRRFQDAYAAILRYLNDIGEVNSGPPFARYYNIDMRDLDVEVGFPVRRPLPGMDEIQAGEIPGGLVAVCHYTGPYESMDPAYEQLARFVRESGYRPSGDCYEWYLTGPDVSPRQRKTDIVFPVTRVPEPSSV